MKISIGENIKKLRKDRDITQEKLSQALNVSVTAVSKWERDETYPDITLLFPLAHYFNVTVDELMGYNKEKIEQDIVDILQEYKRLTGGYADKKAIVGFMKKAYLKYPNDYRIMDKYMWCIVRYEECENNIYLEHKNEFTSICERILEGCTDIHIILSAKSMQGKLLYAQGKANEAIEFYKKEFPDFTISSRQKITNLFDENSPEYDYYNKLNTYAYTDVVAMSLAKIVWCDKENRLLRGEHIGDLISYARQQSNESFFALLEQSFFTQLFIKLSVSDESVDDIARILEKMLIGAKALTDCAKTDNSLKDGISVPYKTDNALKYYVNFWKTTTLASIAKLRENNKIKDVLNKYDS